MINNPAQVGLAEVQQIKVARTPTVLRPTHSGKGPISLKDESNRGRVALPFKMASSSQAKQGGITRGSHGRRPTFTSLPAGNSGGCPHHHHPLAIITCKTYASMQHHL
jgi:hypothetical protein